MQIERNKEEILIRLAPETNISNLQQFIDYLKFMETKSKSKATDNDINNLADESKLSWWQENKVKYIK